MSIKTRLEKLEKVVLAARAEIFDFWLLQPDLGMATNTRSGDQMPIEEYKSKHPDSISAFRIVTPSDYEAR